MKFRLYLLTITLLTLLSCQKQQAQNIAIVDSATFATKIASSENPQVIDVRTPEEFGSEHLVNAKNIDWKRSSFEVEAKKLDKSEPIYVYCRSGARSKQATAKLAELGFTTIYELDGGFMEWSAQGLKSNKN
ncbi:rhodanese-like domain-containing protein [Flavobacterium algicola]|uniref:rhodanese-like domain-containing protein n=1 Tax=Flavobacterium algicola TaxID=556529 RepID=UPI001EFD3F06|nr:rhodanese-like domain-containing protein [Flavobacterium algicola]MCG9793051.1 rhodanese-like domain-containing protein [Flavobacterium algicola]